MVRSYILYARKKWKMLSHTILCEIIAGAHGHSCFIIFWTVLLSNNFVILWFSPRTSRDKSVKSSNTCDLIVFGVLSRKLHRVVGKTERITSRLIRRSTSTSFRKNVSSKKEEEIETAIQIETAAVELSTNFVEAPLNFWFTYSTFV